MVKDGMLYMYILISALISELYATRGTPGLEGPTNPSIIASRHLLNIHR